MILNARTGEMFYSSQRIDKNTESMSRDETNLYTYDFDGKQTGCFNILQLSGKKVDHLLTIVDGPHLEEASMAIAIEMFNEKYPNVEVVRRDILDNRVLATEMMADEGGVDVFAMGADYIPEDNLLPRVNPQRTRRLLEDARAANMNCVRIWGGGSYPDDFFYDICDELGLLVWQDLMYACAFYDLTEDFCRRLIKAAPMPDLGKIAVDDEILRKPGRFEPWEYEKMKAHAAEGGRIVHEILKDTDDDAFHLLAENVARHHHERWDGSGYPDGLKGAEIPPEARIMAIADV